MTSPLARALPNRVCRYWPDMFASNYKDCLSYSNTLLLLLYEVVSFTVKWLKSFDVPWKGFPGQTNFRLSTQQPESTEISNFRKASFPRLTEI